MPLLKKNYTVQEAKPQFLDENLKLKETHNYYAQIQGQMGVTGLTKCFFVVYTTKETRCQVIHFDDIFWADMLDILKSFYLKYVVPEIVTGRLEKQLSAAMNSCVCKEKNKSGVIITCKTCSRCYHLKCVNLRRKPNEWHCNN